MQRPTILVGVVLLVAGSAACGSAGGAAGPTSRPSAPAERPAPADAGEPGRATVSQGAVSPDARARAARADSVRDHYTEADVAFMTGMIHHHAQALVMSRMAPTHGASASVRTLAERIINSQKDEIRRMQHWLADRGEPVPQPAAMASDEGGAGHGMAQADAHEDAGDAHGAHAGHGADGAGEHLMVGMLTPEQMARLDAARGGEWDRLFLTFMIQHHQGAIVMVDELFASYGAGQGDAIFKIAADIGADQASEIDRMQRMLASMVFGSS